MIFDLKNSICLSSYCVQSIIVQANMKMKTVAQVLQQADALKGSVTDTSCGSNEAWISRQNLQDLYQKLLVMDLEYALDKKVEQDLWNHAFKNQINTLQTQSKDKQNPKRAEIQSSLNLFLETASGFYLQLLQELCSAFKLDLPFRRNSTNFGILKEYMPSNMKIKIPKKSSCFYICQHCLVHLGDIARYRQQGEQAQAFYRHAAHLVPYNGQPYNQLAILEAAKSNKLGTVFYYVRSVAVKHPFPVASTNLEKFYIKISKDVVDYRGKLSVTEIILCFLQFHAYIHLSKELSLAARHGERLTLSLPPHIASLSFSAHQLVQMVAVSLFSLHHTLSLGDSDRLDDLDQGLLTMEEGHAAHMILNITVALFDHLLHLTPKQEQKAKEYHTLPAIKVILDWLCTSKNLLSKPVFTSGTIWPNLSKLLNNLQFNPNQKDDVNLASGKYKELPLPEDYDLQYFLPIHRAYSKLCFSHVTMSDVSPDVETKLRCHRLVQHGIFISNIYPNLIKHQKLKSGKYQFSPAVQSHIKSLSELETEPTPEKKFFQRQNVAIQAIMQKHISQQPDQIQDGKELTPARIQHKITFDANPMTDVSVMAYTKEPSTDALLTRDGNDGSPRSPYTEPTASHASHLSDTKMDQAGMIFDIPNTDSAAGIQHFSSSANSQSAQHVSDFQSRFLDATQGSSADDASIVDLPDMTSTQTAGPSHPGGPNLDLGPAYVPSAEQLNVYPVPALAQSSSLSAYSSSSSPANSHTDHILKLLEPPDSLSFSMGTESGESSQAANTQPVFDLFQLGQVESNAQAASPSFDHLNRNQYHINDELLHHIPVDQSKNRDIPVDDSQHNLRSDSLFSQPSDKSNIQMSNPSTETTDRRYYQLFSQSPWSVQIPSKSDSSGPSYDQSSPVGLGSASLSNIADPFSRSPSHSVASVGGDAKLNLGFGPISAGSWQPDSEQEHNYPSSNVQSIWTSGPSPLEKLLEQQQQRHEPH